jgi:hypothetical protein
MGDAVSTHNSMMNAIMHSGVASMQEKREGKYYIL